ncbi:MAG: nuclear transport factor 2 family protein [Burkholderiaceae bacterium]
MPDPGKPSKAHLLASPDDVETQFYDALREADLDRLMAVWSDDDDIVCVHPNGLRVVGVRAIRASFEAIFANGGVPLQADNVKRVHTLGAAMHNLVETVAVLSADGMQRTSVVATNVYLKTALGWRLVAHHASPGDGRDLGTADDAQSTLH